MSSTLFIRPTPRPEKNEWHFKLPIKAIIARRYYDHDGSCGGGMVTVPLTDLDWWEGVLAAGNFDKDDRRDLEKVVATLRGGRTIDMWFEV